jgi:hypothetical protein
VQVLDFNPAQAVTETSMHKHPGPEVSAAESVGALAFAVGNFAQTDGDYATAIPALTLHRRSAPTEPLHCVYSLGLGFVAQGAKQVMLGEEVIDYSPGRSMLTTIDLPVVSQRHPGQCPETVSGPVTDAGCPPDRADGFRVGFAAALERARLSTRLH